MSKKFKFIYLSYSLFWIYLLEKFSNVLHFTLVELFIPAKPFGHYASREFGVISVPIDPCKNGVGCIQQIGGLVPMLSHESCEECRKFDDPLCYKNLAFADVTSPTSTYRNDKNYFLFNGIEFSANVEIDYYLQRLISGVWTDIETLDNNDFGVLIPQNTYEDFPEYTGFEIDWLKVLLSHPEGQYRLKVDTTLYGTQCIGYSETFLLRQFTCELADLTVRFETKITNKFANYLDNQNEFDLCGIDYADSVRLPGALKIVAPEFQEKLIKYQSSGFQKQVRKLTLYKYEFALGDVPQKQWDRFVAYGLSANELFISDYNICNSDYSISKKPIGEAEVSELTKADDHTRLLRAKLNFKDRFQNNIKSNCC